MSEYYKYKNGKDIISMLMVKMNTECANYMKSYKNGIYKILKNENENMNNSDYELYNDAVNYTHITSPIRRLVDILNMYQISKNEKLFQFGENAERFYNKWLNQIDYINVCARNIRKVQSKCKILATCENHTIYKGKIFDKIMINNKYKYNYQVFLTDLKVYCKLLCDTDLNELDEYNFKLFIFNDESQLKKKIKIELC
jgi:exoribonuclease R